MPSYSKTFEKPTQVMYVVPVRHNFNREVIDEILALQFIKNLAAIIFSQQLAS